MLILNLFDVNAPVIQGLPDVSREDTIREVKRAFDRQWALIWNRLSRMQASAVETNGEWNLTSGRAADCGKCPKSNRDGR